MSDVTEYEDMFACGAKPWPISPKFLSCRTTRANNVGHMLGAFPAQGLVDSYGGVV